MSGWEIDGETMRVQLLYFLMLNGTSNNIGFLNNLLLFLGCIHTWVSLTSALETFFWTISALETYLVFFRYVLGAVETFLDAVPSAGLFQSKLQLIWISMLSLWIELVILPFYIFECGSCALGLSCELRQKEHLCQHVCSLWCGSHVNISTLPFCKI